MSEQVITVLGVTGPQGGAVARALEWIAVDDLAAAAASCARWLRRKRAASRDLDGSLVA